jgi:hypothetical protein
MNGDSALNDRYRSVGADGLMSLGFRLVRLASTTLAAFLAGTILNTVLLAAQRSGNPLQAATWILIGAALTMLTRGYGLFVSSHEDEGGGRYLIGLARKIVEAWPIVVASLPTVVLLALAAVSTGPTTGRNPATG